MTQKTIVSLILSLIIISSAFAQDKTFKSVKKEYQRLQQWEATLKLKEELLKQMELELIKEQDKINVIKKNITSILNQIKEIQNANVASLATVYSKMKPGDSAKIINAMDENLAVKIFLKMQPNKIAKILKFISSVKAAKITEKLALYGIKINTGAKK